MQLSHGALEIVGIRFFRGASEFHQRLLHHVTRFRESVDGFLLTAGATLTMFGAFRLNLAHAFEDFFLKADCQILGESVGEDGTSIAPRLSGWFGLICHLISSCTS